MFDFLPSTAPLSCITLDEICFEIKHTKRKNMKRIVLRVEKENEIRLSSPRYVSKKALKAFIVEKKEWIIARNSSLCAPFLTESAFYYLGKALIVEHHDDALHVDEHRVLIDPKRSKKQGDDFYKSAAKGYLPSRVEYWREKMGLEFDTLKFRLAKRRWGSCSSKKVITLNPYVMKLNREMIDYVIVHELAHLTHMNHSKAFYALVEKHLPEHRYIQKEINLLSSKISQ